MKKLTLILLVPLLFISTAAVAADLRTASGAGYKTIVEQWAQQYEQSSQQKVERIYGNMGQILAQAEHGGGVCLVIGDKSYLTTHKFDAARYVTIGTGRPVLVTRKGLELVRLSDLKDARFAKIAAPDFSKAIYGRAAKQILGSTGYAAVLEKTMEAGTVPRSGGYAVSGQVDAAFVNMSYALANREKFSSMLELTEGFEPIEIVAGVVAGCENDVNVTAFLGQLNTDSMAQKVAAAGL